VKVTWTWLANASDVLHAYEARKPAGQEQGLRFDALCGNETSPKTMVQGGQETCVACSLVVRRRLLQGR
jgi:hypothetical protein